MVLHKFYKTSSKSYVRDDGKYTIEAADEILFGSTKRTYNIINNEDGKIIGSWLRLKDAKISCETA